MAIPPVDSAIVELIKEIQANDHWRGKVKTLIARFGYSASQRVRQDTLQWIEKRLEDQNIEARFPGGRSADDYVTLTLVDRVQSKPVISAPPQEAVLAELQEYSAFEAIFDSPRTTPTDILNCIWSSHTVCLIVQGASNEHFSFLCGFLSAILRRRSDMARTEYSENRLPRSIQVVDKDGLRRFIGCASTDSSYVELPRGTTLVCRDNPDDPGLDDAIADVREYTLPHTYRLWPRGRSALDESTGAPVRAAMSDAEWSAMKQWFAAFVGTRDEIVEDSSNIDIASLFAESAELRDALIQRKAHDVFDQLFSAGFESTEHMVMKSAVINHLLEIGIPREQILVEQSAPVEEREDDTPDQVRKNKPDVRVKGKVWVEVETLRSLPLAGSDPFLSLEEKLRHKIPGMGEDEQVWLLVPSDVATLATPQMLAVARNLNVALRADKTAIKFGFVDMMGGPPVFFVERQEERVAPRSQLSGLSRRDKPKATTRLKFDDIAGYSDLKKRVQDDVLDPLLKPERYQQYGDVSANGLLLYGLPGCGKSLMGRVLADTKGLPYRLIAPSDLTSMWLGEGVAKIRELFDWAAKQESCLLIIDELDAVAPQRREYNMHSDEKRQVNELLVRLDGIVGKRVVVVATTNYIEGIDVAIIRSGRFDLKIPVFPPNRDDRVEIFQYYLKTRLKGIEGIGDLDYQALAEKTPLFTPADIKAIVSTSARKAIRRASGTPTLTQAILLDAIREQPRSIPDTMAGDWCNAVSRDIGASHPSVEWLRAEIALVDSNLSTQAPPSERQG